MKIRLDGLELNLTSEQVEELKRQLEVKEGVLPTYWEEAFDMVLPSYYVNTGGGISSLTIEKGSHRVTKSHVPSEKHAKSVLAMCKLMTIAEAYNQGVDGELTYSVADYGESTGDKRLVITDINSVIYGNPILFKKEEHAEHCLEHFMDLWNDFFMI